MEDLSLHILDVAENSLAAGASLITITLTENLKDDLFTVEISDNGRGMDENMLKMATDPFFTTKTVRRVGLGLPLLRQAAEECAGRFSIISEQGKGTTVTATFRNSHIDRKPVGDMASTVTTLIAGSPETNFVFTCRSGDYQYRIDTRELREQLSGVPLSEPQVLSFIKQDIREGLLQITEATHGKTENPRH